MTREGALAVMVAAAVVLIGLGVWAWWRRTRRDAAPLVRPGELPGIRDRPRDVRDPVRRDDEARDAPRAHRGARHGRSAIERR